MTELNIFAHDDAVHVEHRIDGIRHGIEISREAIEDHLGLPPERAAAMTDRQRERFVRNHLARILAIANQDRADGERHVLNKSGEL